MAVVTVAVAKEVVVVVVALTSRRREVTLAGQFLALQLLVVVLLLLVVGAVGVRQATDDFTAEQGARMRSAAENVANFDVVRTQLTALADGGRADGGSARDVDLLLAPPLGNALDLSAASSFYVVGPDGEVLAAVDPTLVGTRADLGESDVGEGRGWTGDVEHGDERVVAHHAPVLAPDGELLGIVVAEQEYPTLGERLSSGVSDLALYLGLGALLGVIGTFAVSLVVRRRTQGLGPTELAGLADQRQALLHSIREGVVAVGTDGRVTMMNDAARATLEVSGDPVGRPVADLGLDPRVVDLLAGPDADVRDAVALVGTRVVVFNRRAAEASGRGIGSVTTLRDRTELVSLQSQLSSNLSITDTLRAQTHEFDNQLHTISGLVQLEEFDEVRTLVGTLTRRRSELGDFIADRIADAAVAALLLAKDAVADERGVALELDPGSRLPSLPSEVSADLTTVLGNLVDNAVDACAGTAEALVEVWLTVLEGSVHLRVRDNGPGVPDDLRDAVFVRGFSTKPEVLGGRGIGLPLVRLICTQRGGRVEVERAAQEGGAEFLVVLPLGETAAGEVG